MTIPGFGELGSTTDPVALVAGSVENVLADACDLRVRADELSDQADGPVSATVPSWTGPSATASNANRANLAQGLAAVADVYRTVAAVLEAHAEVLRWAQTRAQIAIELWARGVELAAASGESTLILRPQPTGPFARSPVFPETDPGAPWRRQAESVLAAARAEVNASGRAAARILDEFSDGMPDGQFHLDQFLGGIGDWITGIATLVWKFNAIRALVDRDAMLDDADQIRQGLWDTGAAITADPTQAVPLLFNTRLMHDNPGRWWGQLFPDIAMTVAGGGVVTKAGWFARSADDVLAVSRGPYPPGSPWLDAAARQRWVDELLEGHSAGPQPSVANWADYQRRVAGPLEVDLYGDGIKIRADGVAVDPDAVVAVDAKFQTSPSSPYIGTADPRVLDMMLSQFDDEVRRYGLVIDDPSNPVARLRIVANTPEAVEFMTARARGVLGDGYDVVGVLEP